MIKQPPYIELEQTKDFLNILANTIHRVENSPQFFQLWGIGGVGKTTLIEKLREQYKDQAQSIVWSFGLNIGVETPIDLMKKLYEQLKPTRKLSLKGFFGQDGFNLLCEKYNTVLHKLETQPLEGKQTVDSQQIALVKKVVNPLVTYIAPIVDPTLIPLASSLGNAVEPVIDIGVLLLSEKDKLQKFLREHKATKQKKDLQELMLNPLSHFTSTFTNSLIEQSKEKPIIIILDTYEKISSEVDNWLCQYILTNRNLKNQQIYFIIAGRYPLLKSEYWRKLQQDRNLLYITHLERFNYEQTAMYAQAIGIKEQDEIKKIYQITKGLPYYLNWIRCQQLIGHKVDFSQGNQEIVMMFMQGLSVQQKKVLQLISCCRWFDKEIINYLFPESLCVNLNVENNCFEWLKQQDCVEMTSGYYRLDDVARDAFRTSLCQDSKTEFYNTHKKMADYFNSLCNELILADIPDYIKFDNADWRKYQAEFLYYSLFCRSNESQIEFISNVFIARCLDQYDIITIPMEAIISEIDIEDSILLSEEMRMFLKKFQSINKYLPCLFDKERLLRMIDYGIEHGQIIKDDSRVQNIINDFNLAVTEATSTCFAKLDSLKGVAKFSACFFKSKNCAEERRNFWLTQAEQEANKFMDELYNEFNSKLFSDILGCELLRLSFYNQAIACFEKAIELNPENYTAQFNYATTLMHLNRYEDAIASYDKALAIKTDYGAWFNRGSALSSINKSEDALSSYNRAIELNPNDNNSLYNKGCLLLDLEQYREALDSFDKALLIKPDDYQSWYNRGVALDYLGNFAEAAVSYQNVLRINLFVDALGKLGIALAMLGQYENSIENFKKALELEPNDEVLLYNLATSQLHLGYIEDALTNFEKALKINSSNDNVLYNYGLVLAELGRYQEALNSLNLISVKDNKAFSLWYHYGRILSLLNRYEEAIDSYTRAIEFNPKNYLSWYYMGNALASLKRIEPAISSYISALTIKPDLYEAWYNQSYLLMDIGKYQEAIVGFEHALKIRPSDYEAWGNRGNAFVNLEKYEEAIENYNHALKLKPDYSEIWCNYGIALQYLEEYEEAITSFDKAIEFNSDLEKAWYQRAVALNHLEQYQEALKSCDKVLAINPNSYEACGTRGNILSHIGQHENALISFDRAADIYAEDSYIWYYRGRELNYLEQYENAILSFDRAIALNTDDYESWYYRGEGLYKLGRLKEAVASCKKALELNPDSSEAWSTLGHTLNEIGNHEEAIVSYNHAILLNPNNYENFYFRGNILAILGKNDEALTSFENALEINPNYSKALHQYGLILSKSEKYEEAILKYDKALAINSDNDIWCARGISYATMLFTRPTLTGEVLLKDWQEVITSIQHIENDLKLLSQFFRVLSDLFVFVAKANNNKAEILEFIKGLIKASGLETNMFSLISAIDYILMDKKELPEEISLEVRTEIDALIRKIQEE